MSVLPHYDSIRELGAYDQLPSDVKAQLPQIFGLPGYSLPPLAKVKAEDAMIEYPEKTDTPESLSEKLKVFGDNVVKVDQAFKRVKKGLGEVDAKDYKDNGGKLIPKLQSTWVGYQDVSSAISKYHLVAAINCGNKLSAGRFFFGIPVLWLLKLRLTSKVCNFFFAQSSFDINSTLFFKISWKLLSQKSKPSKQRMT